MTQLSIYEQMVEENIEIDNHESDMYVEVNEATREILRGYKFYSTVTTFTCNVTGKRFYDIPFAYTPYWDKAGKWVRGG